MLDELKEAVFKANQDLSKSGLAILTFGNASGIDRRREIVAIKPSGVPYAELKVEDIILTDLEGKIIEGWLKPSSDLPTHLELYKAFPDIGGAAHAHSSYATMFAQARKDIKCYGTTHADHFAGPVPATRPLTAEEVDGEYEINTGRVIVERFARLDPARIPAVLVAGHGPFTWGDTPDEAVRNGIVLEHVAKIAFGTLLLNRRQTGLEAHVLRKHYQRKHGPDATYGQDRPRRRES
jgi:L-ribulose-5-phosphate 4-epimerase